MTSYRPLDAEALRACLGARATLAARLGGAPADWVLREVSDGNLNTVFLVEGPSGALCCKQSLPHVRVDPDWKMPLDRTDFEARYMQAVSPFVGHLMPEFHAFDAELHLLVMEGLTHHRVLRTALADGTAAAGFSARIGEYVGRTAFHTSWRGRPFEAVMQDVARFARNTTLTRITVDLVLTDPYVPDCPRNRPLSPDLDEAVAALQSDSALRDAVSRLQERFLCCPQALLHGDLHTGSVMVHGDDVRVIDGEFALMGPIGFDCGLYLGNLLLHACARPERREWMQDEIALFWRSLEPLYRDLWDERPQAGDVGALLSPDSRRSAQAAALRAIRRDSAGFAGLELIRRTIGYAQVADYALTPDRVAEAEARRRALALGRNLILGATMDEAVEACFQ
ncbi:S-methyl-5-thioribose kinase [Acidomonas methanolica]|uniref:S-methyl-5-thioribose kinase n=1 Tax=Acidomonas methanolica TaxID=437 RepID=UPI00211A8DA2|nr:S-methyl-5-thioribose kinase [Acidomonas methanolica]MCQ9155396.1 S-methyl-5-thioribose kinase [Acidomonas methanolica]